MKTIPLTQGKVALVDDEDYEQLNKHKWFAFRDGHTYYALRNITIGKKRQTTLRMHRVILGDPPKDMYTDHIDGNGLNNQKSNLRIVTRRQNNQNLVHLNKTSKYPGIHWHTRDCAWIATIKINGKLKRLGSSKSEESASGMYVAACAALGCKVIKYEKNNLLEG